MFGNDTTIATFQCISNELCKTFTGIRGIHEYSCKGKVNQVGSLVSVSRGAHLLFSCDWARFLSIQCYCERVTSPLHKEPVTSLSWYPFIQLCCEEEVRVKSREYKYLAQGHNITQSLTRRVLHISMRHLFERVRGFIYINYFQSKEVIWRGTLMFHIL